TSIGAPTVLTPADGTLTNERTPTVTLTADAGTTDTVYIDGARVGTTFADGFGYASLALTGALGDGPHTVRATAADGLGHVSAARRPAQRPRPPERPGRQPEPGRPNEHLDGQAANRRAPHRPVRRADRVKPPDRRLPRRGRR